MCHYLGLALKGPVLLESAEGEQRVRQVDDFEIEVFGDDLGNLLLAGAVRTADQSKTDHL